MYNTNQRDQTLVMIQMLKTRKWKRNPIQSMQKWIFLAKGLLDSEPSNVKCKIGLGMYVQHKDLR